MHAFCHHSHNNSMWSGYVSHITAMEYKITMAPPSLPILQSSSISKRQNLVFCASIYQHCSSCKLITTWQSQSWKCCTFKTF